MSKDKEFYDGALPDVMTGLKRWCLWRKEDGNKKPYQINGKAFAKQDKPATWSSYPDAIAALMELADDGFQLGVQLGVPELDNLGIPDLEGYRFVGVDFDDAYEPREDLLDDGPRVMRPWAKELWDVIKDCCFYAEVSPSGNGFKAWMVGRYDGPSRFLMTEQGESQKLEVFGNNRYFAVTGETFGIRERNATELRYLAEVSEDALAELEELANELSPVKKQEKDHGKLAEQAYTSASQWVEVPISQVPLEERLERGKSLLASRGPIGEGNRSNELLGLAGMLVCRFKIPKPEAFTMLDRWAESNVEGYNKPDASGSIDIGSDSVKSQIERADTTGSPPPEAMHSVKVSVAKSLGIDPDAMKPSALPLEVDFMALTDSNTRDLLYDSWGLSIDRSQVYLPPELQNRAFTLLEMMDEIPDACEYVVDGLFLRHQLNVIAGPSKAMKTTTALALVMSLASGRPFLGQFKVSEPKRVLMYSGETSLRGIVSRAPRVAEACGIKGQQEFDEMAERLKFRSQVPNASNMLSIEAFCRDMEEHKPDVVVIDPLYLASDCDVQANIAKMGQQLRAFQMLVQDRGADLIFVHHSKKGFGRGIDKENGSSKHVSQAMELSDMSGAGISENAGAWLLLSRDKRFGNASKDGVRSHGLHFNYGNREGDGALLKYQVVEHRAEVDGKKKFKQISFHLMTPEETSAAKTAQLMEESRLKIISDNNESRLAERKIITKLVKAEAVGSNLTPTLIKSVTGSVAGKDALTAIINAGIIETRQADTPKKPTRYKLCDHSVIDDARAFFHENPTAKELPDSFTVVTSRLPVDAVEEMASEGIADESLAVSRKRVKKRVSANRVS